MSDELEEIRRRLSELEDQVFAVGNRVSDARRLVDSIIDGRSEAQARIRSLAEQRRSAS